MYTKNIGKTERKARGPNRMERDDRITHPRPAQTFFTVHFLNANYF